MEQYITQRQYTNGDGIHDVNKDGPSVSMISCDGVRYTFQDGDIIGFDIINHEKFRGINVNKAMEKYKKFVEEVLEEQPIIYYSFGDCSAYEKDNIVHLYHIKAVKYFPNREIVINKDGLNIDVEYEL